MYGSGLASASGTQSKSYYCAFIAVYFDFDFEPLNDAAQSSMHNSSAAVDSQTIIGIVVGTENHADL